MTYDYIKSKKRVYGILGDPREITASRKLNTLHERIKDVNGIETYVTAIFVNILNSESLLKDMDISSIAKLLRTYSSESLEILCSVESTPPLEAGVLGDIVYGIYSTPTRQMIYEVAEAGFYLNTMVKMLNKIFDEKGLPTITVQIGISTGKDVVINATTLHSNMDDKIIYGRSVSKARDFCRTTTIKGPIILDRITHYNLIEIMKDHNQDKDVESWFHVHDYKKEECYSCDVIKTEFNKWIDQGMNEY